MKSLPEKLNFKGQNRIAVINAAEDFILALSTELKDVRIDTEIDQRYPYTFMIIFVRKITEVRQITPVVLHNLALDGVLWFCYPKKSPKKLSSGTTRDNGWKTLNDSGFFGVRMVSVDDNWSALRFRNVRFIKSTSDRFKV
ncbi:MAG: hypothetical protein K0B05_02610 [Bacteroidales bacterium]|nr:hypothetical protein [Bacteroidales bacterium]